MRHTNFVTAQSSPSNTKLLRTAIVACLGVTSVMVWALVWGPNRSGGTASIGTQSSPTTSPGRFGVESSGPMPKSASDTGINSSMLSGQTVRYYENLTGRAFSVDLRTLKHEIISDTKLPGFERAIWSPSGGEVVGVFDQAPLQSYRYFSYATQKVAPIGKSPLSAAFSPNGRRLAYIDQEDESAVVYIAAPDGADARRVLATRVSKPSLTWLDQDSLLLLSQRPDRTGRDLTIVHADGTLAPLIDNKENLDYVSSPNGAKLLFSYFMPNDGVQLMIMDVASQQIMPLGLSTSAQKCAWAPDALTVVCGVPPDDALAEGVEADHTATLDDIVVVSVATGVQQKIYSSRRGTLLGVSDPLVSSSFFAFTNLFDHHLYRIELPR